MSAATSMWCTVKNLLGLVPCAAIAGHNIPAVTPRCIYLVLAIAALYCPYEWSVCEQRMQALILLTGGQALALCSSVTVILEIWNPSLIDSTKSSNLIVKKADLTKLLSNWFKHQSILHYVRVSFLSGMWQLFSRTASGMCSPLKSGTKT